MVLDCVLKRLFLSLSGSQYTFLKYTKSAYLGLNYLIYYQINNYFVLAYLGLNHIKILNFEKLLSKIREYLAKLLCDYFGIFHQFIVFLDLVLFVKIVKIM